MRENITMNDDSEDIRRQIPEKGDLKLVRTLLNYRVLGTSCNEAT